VLIGSIDSEFMDVPPEILQTSMRTHQKYFALRDGKTGKLARRFALVPTWAAEEWRQGDRRGERARAACEALGRKILLGPGPQAHIGSHASTTSRTSSSTPSCGTQLERVERIEALAGEIAKIIGADVTKAKRAARLCKADLTTGVVGEFPELQGAMGGYYAEHDGEDDEVAIAIIEHYGRDRASENDISNCVALADRWDLLSNFFSIGEKPTGSGDPYALRRAALGIIRILNDRKLRIPLSRLPLFTAELLSFFADRLKVALREGGGPSRSDRCGVRAWQ